MECVSSFWQMIASFIVGSGHGMIILTTEETTKEYIGARYWSKTRGSLKMTVAILLIFLTVLMKYILQNYRIEKCFGLFAIVQSVSGLIFLILIFVKLLQKNSDSMYIF